MKIYSNTLFILKIVTIGINILISAYFRDIAEIIAWSIIMFESFRMRYLEKLLDDSERKKTIGLESQLKKIRKEICDAD